MPSVWWPYVSFPKDADYWAVVGVEHYALLLLRRWPFLEYCKDFGRYAG